MSDDVQVEELRDDIDQTRESMSETIGQLEERLAPERLQQDTSDIVREVADKIIAEIQGKTGDLTQQIADQVQSAIHGAATAKSEEVLTQAAASIRTIGTSLWDRVGRSPAPVALAAVGIGLLAAGSGSAGSSSGGSGDAANSGSGVRGIVDGVLAKANSVAERATGAVSNASQESGNLLDHAKGMVGDTAETPGQVRGLVSDQPLVAGLVALGLGAAMGLSMPATAKERDAASSLRTQVQNHLGEMGIATDAHGMMEQAKQGVGSLAGNVTESASAGLAQAKHAAGDIATTAKETAIDAAHDRGLSG